MTMEPAPSVPSEIIAEGFVCTTLLSLFRGLVRQRNHRKTLGISWKLSLIYSWFLISWLWIWWIFGMMGLYICICICIYNQDNYMYIWDYTCVYYTCVYIYMVLITIVMVLIYIYIYNNQDLWYLKLYLMGFINQQTSLGGLTLFGIERTQADACFYLQGKVWQNHSQSR